MTAPAAVGTAYPLCETNWGISAFNACRYHIAVPWLLGGVLLLVLPITWMHNADAISYVLLVLASMGIMGSDGECEA